MHIPHQCLDRSHDQRHPQRHREHGANGGRAVSAQQMPGRGGTDKQRAAEECRYRHVQQAVREGGVKHHGKPVHRNNLTVNDFIPLRCLHPAV